MTLLEELEAAVAKHYPDDRPLAPSPAYAVRISDPELQVLCEGPYEVEHVDRTGKDPIYHIHIPPMTIKRSGYATWLTYQCGRFLMSSLIDDRDNHFDRRDFTQGGIVVLTASIIEPPAEVPDARPEPQ